MTNDSELRRDERGAIMLIALFFAIFAIAMLYLGIGAGEAVLFREHLQDAADAAALSGAIAHARLMNVLVLINVVMSVLLAILVALKLIEGICYVGTVICAGLAWVTFGATLAAIPPLAALAVNMSNLYQSLEPNIFSALETLHDVGDEISKAAPKAADVLAQADFADNSGVVSSGFAAPTSDSLPVDDDKYERLCGKAGAMVIEIAKIPLDPIPGLGEAMGALEGPMQTMTSALSRWFCGDGQNSVPNLDQDLEQSYPRTDKTKACQGSQPNQTFVPGDEKSATTPACDEANRENAAAKSDDRGTCVEQCDVGGPYDLVVTRAREDCDPNGKPTPRKYQYQIQEGNVEYVWNGQQWVRGVERITSSRANKKDPEDPNPCGDPLPPVTLFDDYGASIRNESDGTVCGHRTTKGFLLGYSRLVHPADEPSRTLPACSNECPPQTPPPETEKDPRRKVSFRQVTHILACERHERVVVPVKDVKSPGKVDGNSKSPKRITEKASLGTEEFQIRSLAVGNPAQKQSARLVSLSLWGAPDPNNPLERLKTYGGFAFAQAEYYYDSVEANRDEWMWTMNWRARLRRFQLKDDKDGDAASRLKSRCQDHIDSERCSQWLQLIGNWNDLLIH